MEYVIDASVAVRWLLHEEGSDTASVVLAAVLRNPQDFAVPELFAFETYSVLCRLHPNPTQAFLDGISPVLSSGILRYPMTDSIARRAAPFTERKLTGYDAVYLALAEEVEACWLTFDGAAHRLIEDLGRSRDLSEGIPPGLEG